MSENHFPQGAEMKEIIHSYHQLKKGHEASRIMDEDIFALIIDYFDEREELHEAITAAGIGLTYFPFSSQLMIKKADLLIADLKYTDALELLDAAYLLDANDINVYILWIDAYLGQEQIDKAEGIWQEALKKFEGEERLELLFELSDVYDDYENFDKVFDCLKLILKEDPANEEALYKICFWTDQTGRNEESIRLHQEIIDIHPYSELAWFNLASAYQGLKLYEKAIDAYQYAVTINESFDYAYRNMGDAYMRIRKYKEAIESLEKVLELTRPEEVIYEAIGHCYHKMHEYIKARLHYRKALHLHQEDYKLLYKIALTYMDQEQWENALNTLKAAAGMSHAPELNLALGECYLQLEDFTQAIHHFGVVVHQRSKNIPGWEALIRCLYISGYFEEASRQSLAAIEATDHRPIFHFYYSMAQYALGNLKDCLLHLELGMSHAPKMFKKALELNPSILQNSKVIDIIAKYKRAKR